MVHSYMYSGSICPTLGIFSTLSCYPGLSFPDAANHDRNLTRGYRALTLSPTLCSCSLQGGRWHRHTWHTYTLELPNLVQASGIILTRVGDALVDINLTAWPRVALQTLALKGAQCVDALACMLTGVGTWWERYR